MTAIGLVYAATGTLNLADLRGALAGAPDGVRPALDLLLLVVFGIKAALFPLYFWLPDSYPVAPGADDRGVRGPADQGRRVRDHPHADAAVPGRHRLTGPVLLVVAGLTMVIGILGAIAQNEIKRCSRSHIVSHIGYMVHRGSASSPSPASPAPILYVVHHIVIQTTLFLRRGAGGAARRDRRAGPDQRPARTGPVYRRCCSLLPALVLAGIPPFSGFVAKLALLQAGSSVARG